MWRGVYEGRYKAVMGGDWSAGHAVQSGREKEDHNHDHVMACCFYDRAGWGVFGGGDCLRTCIRDVLELRASSSWKPGVSVTLLDEIK